MSVLDEIRGLSDYSDPRNVQPTESLISKYNIPIDHFEFAYVEKCHDGRELEKILQILKSGEEGYYPGNHNLVRWKDLQKLVNYNII